MPLLRSHVSLYSCSPRLHSDVDTFWEITKKDLEDREAELRNKDREMEEMEERHQVEIKVCKQGR